MSGLHQKPAYPRFSNPNLWLQSAERENATFRASDKITLRFISTLDNTICHALALRLNDPSYTNF